MKAAGSRLQRLLGGWSANLFQLILGVTQQLALVPVFLHYCPSDMLAAWLALYAAGNLVLIADAGLMLARHQPVSCAQVMRRRRRANGAILCGDAVGSTWTLSVALIVAILAAMFLVSPSDVLGFRSTAEFDASFVIMTAGMLMILPASLASGLYRARGLYGRAVWIQCAAMLIAQLAQAFAIATTGRLA